MNKPIPALDENNEFVVAVCRDGAEVPVYTLDNGSAQISGECRWWRLNGTSICEGHPELDIINLDELRATVERARKMRPKFPTRGAHDVAEFYKDEAPAGTYADTTGYYTAPARPTFAEALAAEAQQYNSRNVEWTELRSIIERARRASEG